MRRFARGITLLICAASCGSLVCGRPPGHRPPHRDVEWNVYWEDR